MTPAEALAEVKRARPVLQYSRHARDRMNERQVQVRDVERAIDTASAARFNKEKGTWRIEGGVDREGCPLAVTVGLKPRAVTVVTVFED